MIHFDVKSKPHEDISILISVDNMPGKILAECGYASKLRIKDIKGLELIFVSHTHIDHFINFDNIIRHQLGQVKKVVVCGPLNIARQVQAKLMAYNWNLLDYPDIAYEVRECDEDGYHRYMIASPDWQVEDQGYVDSVYAFENAFIQVQKTILDHKTPCLAYLIQEKPTLVFDVNASTYDPGDWISKLKSAFLNENHKERISVGGRMMLAEELFHLLTWKSGDTLGVIMDHGVTDENHRRVKRLFSGSNQVLIESFFMVKDKEVAMQNAHSFSVASAQIMKQCGVQKPVPVHFSRKYSYAEMNELKEEFFKEFNK